MRVYYPHYCMAHNIKTKQKVYGTSGSSLEGKEWCAADMQLKHGKEGSEYY